MHMHKSDDGQEPEEIDASQGYEQSDAHVIGIATFLGCLFAFVAIAGALSYAIGMGLNAELNREDGPTNKWSKNSEIRQLGNLPANPEMQNKVAETTEQFPAPRLQTDDGNQDVADLHAREDLLLTHYSWADKGQGKVRIPISRAMELIAARGLPVAPVVVKAPMMTADQEPSVTQPLTSGFARTAYELEAARTAEAAKKQEAGK